VYNSITSYVWAVRVWHVLQHQADPVMGVMHWREFMQAMAVLCSVPNEPREAMPRAVIEHLLDNVDWGDFVQVQMGLVVLVLYFTFSRTECALPKHFTGAESFDPTQHWTRGDFKLRLMDGVYVLWVRFKAYKQDPRIERPEAVHATEHLPFDPATEKHQSRDWVPIGDVPGNQTFSIARWFMRFVELLGRARADDDYMFFARDMARPYTYTAFISDLTTHLPEGFKHLRPHGIRVEGYNNSLRGNGVDLTVAHGGWKSSGHSRYERFSRVAMLSISANMIGETSGFSDGTVRDLRRSRLVRGAPALAGDQGGASAEPVEGDGEDEVPPQEGHRPAGLNPPGYTETRQVAESGRSYAVFVAPNGVKLYSRPAAWRHHIRFGAVEDGPSRSPSAQRGTGIRRSAAVLSSSLSSSLSFHFPDDLSTHVVESDRPSRRKTPAARLR